MTFPVVVVDANVLFSRTLRSWFFNLATQGSPPSFSLVSTEDINAEAIARIRDRYPDLDGGVITQIARQLREVCTIQEDFDGSLRFPGDDVNDSHVHSAAVEARAGYLVTADTGFHTIEDTDALPYEVYTPDDFLMLANEQSRERVLMATRENLKFYQKALNRSADTKPLADALKASGCPKFAEVVTENLILLSGASRREARDKMLQIEGVR